MRLIQFLARDAGEQIQVDSIDLRRSFGAVGFGSVGGNIEGLVGIIRAIEIVRCAQIVGGINVPIVLAENRAVPNLMLDGQAFVLVHAILKEAE